MSQKVKPQEFEDNLNTLVCISACACIINKYHCIDMHTIGMHILGNSQGLGFRLAAPPGTNYYLATLQLYA